MFQKTTLSTTLLSLLVLAVFSGCTPRSETPDGGIGYSEAYLPKSIESKILELEEVENLSETVANRLIDFSDSVRKRDFHQASTFLSDDFRGSSFESLDLNKAQSVPGGALKVVKTYTIEKNDQGIDTKKFIESLEALIAPLESIDYVFFKTRGAEFEKDKSRGVLKMTVNIIGKAANQTPQSLYGWAQAEVVKSANDWKLRRFILNKFQVLTRPRTLFTDVAPSAGLAVLGGRLGGDGNRSFYWRGAATSDFDNDGDFDIFTSGPLKNYLYQNQGDGTFKEVIANSGIKAQPGVTGPLFFDYDRDGDADLFLGYVGWYQDQVPAGYPLKLFRNDGGGKFTDVSFEMGLSEIYACAFTASAADIDQDGYLDLHISCYNRLDTIAPDSWYKATNGTKNLLLKNQQGKKFVDIAEKAGVANPGWSYAASFCDFDEDGDQDFYLANDYGDNALYQNQGDGTFKDVAKEYGVLDTGNGMAVTWGDMNNDGRLDLYVSNMSSSAGNRILRRFTKKDSKSSGEEVSNLHQTLLKLAAGNTIFQHNGKKFELIPPEYGGIGASWAWSASILDINLDGLLDVYVANGFISGDSLKDT